MGVRRTWQGKKFDIFLLNVLVEKGCSLSFGLVKLNNATDVPFGKIQYWSPGKNPSDALAAKNKKIQPLLCIVGYFIYPRLGHRQTLRLSGQDVLSNVSCRPVLFNLFVIVVPLIYFNLCHGTPIK